MADSSDRRRVGPLSEWVAEPTDEVLEESVPQVLARQVAKYGDRPAVYWAEGDGLAHLTYAELAEAAAKVARALAGQAAPGERVAVWSRNSIPWIVLEYASAMAGLVLVPVNTLWTDAEVAHAVQLTKPRLLFAGPGRTGESLASRASVFAGELTVVDIADLDAWVGAVSPGELPEVAPGDPFLIQFTSGTTGRSKGAVLSHRNALNGAYQRNCADVIPENDVYLNPVPFHHVGGSCSVMLGGVVDAGAFVLLEKWDPAEVARILGHGVVTRIGGVPTMILDLLDRLGDDARQFELASVSLGGAKVPEQLILRVGEVFGAPVVVTYAQSESPMITSTRVGDDPSVIATTVGRPMAAVDLKIVHPGTDEVVPLGVSGEILARAPYVMMGYWDMPAQTAATITADGYLRTGDLAEMDEHGYITFRGRARDVIIRGGENIYPAEVEEILLEHPGVASAVLVGIDDERLGEQVAGVVVRAPGSEVTADDLAAFLADRVARFKIPIAWRFVESYPMTASGKVRRFVVREETNTELAAGHTAASM